jgi:TPR repeat protein
MSSSGERLTLRHLVQSAALGNKDNTLIIGNYYFSGRGFTFTGKNYYAALQWYLKSSSMGSGLASLYAGAMNHFGIGCDSNLIRARRYYELALKDSTLHYSLQWIASMLDSMSNTNSQSIVSRTSNSIASQLVQLLWDDSDEFNSSVVASG